MFGNRPLIGVISDRRMLGAHAFHMVGEKYLRALVDGADGHDIACKIDGIGAMKLKSEFVKKSG